MWVFRFTWQLRWEQPRVGPAAEAASSGSRRGPRPPARFPRPSCTSRSGFSSEGCPGTVAENPEKMFTEVWFLVLNNAAGTAWRYFTWEGRLSYTTTSGRLTFDAVHSPLSRIEIWTQAVSHPCTAQAQCSNQEAVKKCCKYGYESISDIGSIDKLRKLEWTNLPL